MNTKTTPQTLRLLAPGVSLGVLARRTGISRPLLSRIVNGKRGLTVSKARAIAHALGVRLERVIEAIDGPFFATPKAPNRDDARRKTRDVKPPKGQRCEDCGTARRQLQKHHESYADPSDFTWLCRPCHDKRHGSEYNSRSPRKSATTTTL